MRYGILLWVLKGFWVMNSLLSFLIIVLKHFSNCVRTRFAMGSCSRLRARLGAVVGSTCLFRTEYELGDSSTHGLRHYNQASCALHKPPDFHCLTFARSE